MARTSHLSMQDVIVTPVFVLVIAFAFSVNNIQFKFHSVSHFQGKPDAGAAAILRLGGEPLNVTVLLRLP